MERTKKVSIILASASPRRSEILDNLKIPFKKRTSSFDEASILIKEPIELVKALAYEKAKNVIYQADMDEIYIGADTVVVFNGEILGKPKDIDEAYMYLKMLSGKVHSVFTGLSLIHPFYKKTYIDYCETKVYMRNFNEKEITAYINTNEPMDKAGAYGIQGFGAVLIDKIEGDYFNVVGLPISKLIDGLSYLGLDYFDSFHN